MSRANFAQVMVNLRAGDGHSEQPPGIGCDSTSKIKKIEEQTTAGFIVDRLEEASRTQKEKE